MASQLGNPFPLISATEDPWLAGLREVVLSCFTQTRMEMESAGKSKCGKDEESRNNNVPWTITSTVTILTSDADIQRKSLVEYISTTNGIRPLLELIDATAQYKVGEKSAKILRELVSQKNGKHRTAIVKQCVDVNYLAVTVSVLKQLVKGTSNSPGPSSKASNCSSSAASPPSAVSIQDDDDDDNSADQDNSSSGIQTGGDSANSQLSSGCYSEFGNGSTTTVDFIWFLAGVVAKDSHFPDKVRQMLKVKFFHDIYKRLFFAKSNLHFPLLKIMRQLSKCRRVAEILGKDKVMNTAKKTIAILSSQPNQKMLMLMEWLSFLTRDRKNSIRFLKAGLLVKVLNIFRHWSHWKGKGLLKLSKSIINIYAHLARTKSGKKSLAQTDAITVIRQFCEQCPSERSFDDVIMRACAMIHVCCGKEHLPLDTLECPIKFEIPRTSAPDGSSDYPGFLLLAADSGSSSDEDGDPEDEDGDGKDDDSDSDADNGSVGDDNGSESDLDDLLDDEGVPEGQEVDCQRQSSSRKGSIDIVELGEEQNERMTLNRIAQFSFFFREFSSRYAQENEQGESEDLGTQLEKIEHSMGLLCSLEEEPSLQQEGNSCVAPSVPLIPQYPSSVHKYSWTSRHGAKLPRLESLRKLYYHLANKIKHVSPFTKIAYPDICFGLSGKQVESLCANTDRTVLRRKVQSSIQRAMSEHPGFRPKVVYNLDELITTKGQAGPSKIGNMDETNIGKYDSRSPLTFESRFESGNLRKAIQVGDYEYDLLLTSDINSSRHNQWFYFQVANVSDDQPYTFNIINCIKTNSLFNYGMQPVVYSVTDAVRNHKPGWVRSGSNIVYCRNGYKCIGKRSVKTYHTLSFTLQFHNRGDFVYVAYHIPFTYTRLMVEIHNLLGSVKHSEKVHCRYDVLCKSLDGNDIPLLTVTGPIENPNGQQHRNSRIQDREVVFITSRVHPGETNASWVMMGILRKLLLGNHMEELLQRYVFKIIPMLNAEGVINGCHRSGLTSQDLNRCWKNPHEVLHPSIYNAKMLVAYCCKVRGRPPTAFVDLHGHSRRKNAFFYGCSLARSWRQEDRVTPENPQKLYALAESMSVHCPYFVQHFCHYDVRKSRETTARVAVWREFGVTCSFTLECSYCGADRGPCKGIAFGTGQLWEIGESLCEAISTMDCKLQMPQQKLTEITENETVAVIESYIE